MGISQASDRLIAVLSKSPTILTATNINSDTDDLTIPSLQTLNLLNEKATFRLAEMTKGTFREAHEAAEIFAAKKLLDKATKSTQR